MKRTAGLRKPPQLRQGDIIGVVAPAGGVKAEPLQNGVKELERLGYRVVLSDHVLARHRYFAGEHKHRAESLVAFLEDPKIKAVFCARGGYGSNYVVEYLRSPRILSRLKKLPQKIFMGYSDITTLLVFLHQELGWVSFQGPLVSADFGAGESGYNRKVFEQVLSKPSESCVIKTDGFTLRKGIAEGRLIGGCLSIICAGMGTPEEIDTRDSILLLEDIDERPYRVDRLLFQLRRAGKLRGVKAVVFGEMVGCREKGSPADDLREIIDEALAGLDIPVVFGVRYAHTTGGCLTLPMGVRARLSAGKTVSLTFMESAVEAPKESKRRAGK